MTNPQTLKSSAEATSETRVGHMTTSVLQDMCSDYIRAFTVNGRFTGDVHYLIQYNALREYDEHAPEN